MLHLIGILLKVPNALGAVLALVQLVLFVVYPAHKDVEYEFSLV